MTEPQPPSKAETFIMTISFERTLMRDGRALLALLRLRSTSGGCWWHAPA